MILVDTDILVDISRRYRPSLEAVERHRSSGPVAVSVVSRMELMIGCRNAQDKRAANEILGAFAVVPVSGPASMLAADFVEDYYLSNGMLMADALIAATAVAHGYPLLTRNRKHFDYVPGMRLVPAGLPTT